jgi:hypothetical protein
MAAVLSLPREEVMKMVTMTDDERSVFLIAFGLVHEDEIIGALATINRQMQSTEASAFEAADTPGKQPPEVKPSPDGSPPSIGSQSETESTQRQRYGTWKPPS